MHACVHAVRMHASMRAGGMNWTLVEERSSGWNKFVPKVHEGTRYMRLSDEGKRAVLGKLSNSAVYAE